MKKLTLFLLISVHFLAKGQDRNVLFEQAMKKLQSADYQGGIAILNQIISKNTTDFPAFFNRAVALSILHKYELALADISVAIKLKPESKKAFLNRGIIYKKLTNYDAALIDFEKALKLDPKYAEVFYNKGLLFEYLGKIDDACTEFRTAKNIGLAMAYPKVDFCETPTDQRVKTFSILKLSQISEDKTYGFSEKNPVNVGTGSNGGLENEQTYLDLLRDDTGKPINYKFIGKCCDFKTRNATSGYLSIYEISYQLKGGKPKTTKIYLNQFEYIEPQVLVGIKPFIFPK